MEEEDILYEYERGSGVQGHSLEWYLFAHGGEFLQHPEERIENKHF